MTNEVKNETTAAPAASTQVAATTDAAPDASAEMDAWTMCVSLLVGLHKADIKAREEHEAISRATSGMMCGPGMGKALAIRGALNDALKTFDADIRQIARSNGLTLPEMPR